MLKKNDIVPVRITALSNEGVGIARYSDAELQNFVLYIPFTAVGDELDCRVLKVLRSYGFGKIERLRVPSPDREAVDCSAFGVCGGCVYRHLSYAAELRAKREAAVYAYGVAFGRENGIEIAEAAPSPQANGYRNKVQYPVSADGRCAFFASRSHRAIPVGSCALEAPVFAEVKRLFEEYVQKSGVTVYDESTRRGLVRHLYLRAGDGGVCAVVVAAGKKLPREELLISLLSGAPEVKSIWLNTNTADTNVILGRDYRLLWGAETITDTLCGIRMRISPQSFYQVNRPQAERLYEKAISLAALTQQSRLLDLYCGIGSIGMAAAKSAGEVLGVELVPEAIADARRIATENGIANIRFRAADAATLSAVLAEERFTPDCVIVDPPRKGLDPATLSALAALSCPRIVYISCNPMTQARDAKTLAEAGYSIGTVYPFDMFPRTEHVETVCLLTRESTTHDMKLNPEPFEMIKSGKKTIELRLFDEKRQKIKVGDSIIFTGTVTGKTLTVKVEKLHRFDTFDELYQSLPLLKCGYTEETVADATPSDMEEYYSAEEQKKYGVVGIEISRTNGTGEKTESLLSKGKTDF